MHYWLFSWMGQANDQWSKLFFPVNLLCFLVLFFNSLKKVRGSLGGLIFSYFLVSCPLLLYHATIGYADFIIAAYFSLGVIFFYGWAREREDVYFWLFAVFFSLTSWVKLEGKPLFILGGILLLLHLFRQHGRSFRPILKRVFHYFLVYAVIGLPWQVLLLVNQVSTREKFAFHLAHFFELQARIYGALFGQGSWGIIWLAIVASILFFYKDLFRKENIYLVLTGLLFYGIILFIYLFLFISLPLTAMVGLTLALTGSGFRSIRWRSSCWDVSCRG
jgi:hypothetical protein